MNVVVKNIIRLILILFVQVFILNNITPLHQLIVPYFYFIFILWLPFKTSRSALLLIGFVVGMLVDMFYKTPGLHTAAVVLVSYMRPYIIGLLMPKEVTEWGNEEPTRFTMGLAPFSTYVVILTLMHNGYLILLEWMDFGSFLYFLGKLIATSLVSLILVMIGELFIHRKTRQR